MTLMKAGLAITVVYTVTTIHKYDCNAMCVHNSLTAFSVHKVDNGYGLTCHVSQWCVSVCVTICMCLNS